MDLSVIISYYKAIDNLKIILKALNRQSVGGFEVLISEDDCNEETENYLKKYRNSFSFPIVHLNQVEDKGFRKNEMLNKSIVNASSERLAFIDGDCVPHKHFVKEYIKNMDENHLYSGRAVGLDKKVAESLVKTQSLGALNYFSLIFSNSKKIKEGIYFTLFPLTLKKRGLNGRNWGIYKKNMIDINGFDTDYVLAGVGEDVDIEWRLRKNGIDIISMKNKAIVYHIYHQRTYSEDGVQTNFKLLEKKKQLGVIKCRSGIEELEVTA